jgi:ABC-type multidrug transport system fused ATPase/permease subunit
VKEFVIYTLLRLVVLVATFAIVAGIWLLFADSLDWFWTIVIAFVLSGVASYPLLNRPRAAFANRVETRAERAAAAFEAMKTKEDANGD